VRGGEVDMGTLAGAAAISYGRNGTRFNQSGGTVTVHATGKGQTGTGNGFILAHTPTGGGCHEFNVSGGLFTVPESSINFNERTNTINVTGSGIVRAKGVFSCKATSTGVVNARDGGRVEIGALGWKAGSATFNMSEGVLCGYEAGAFVSNVVTLVGDATFTSESGVTLAANGCVQGGGGLTVGTAGKIGAVSLGGDNTYEGGTTVAVGTLKLAHVNGFGSGAVAVMNNATLDLCGICPTNPIALVGSGVGGAGALVNSGEALDGTNALNLVLADDATLGGSARIWGGNGSCLNLAGHKLTVSGDSGFAFVLATNAVDNVHGGTLVLAGGSFATSGNVSLGTADIEIQSGGTLDLSTGSRISCRNFRSTGRVVGTVATNVVRGILHATSATELTNLELADGATLSGTGLEVSSFLRLGTVLYVEVPEGQTRIATVPETTDVGATTVFYNGRNGYVLRRAGKDLRVVAEHTVTANIAIGSTVAGVNFESLIVSGKVSDFEGKVTGATGATNIYVRAEGEDGSVITRKFEYTGSDDGKFEYTLDDVDLGASYRISAYVEIEGAEVEAYSRRVDAVVARSVNWVDENAKTFAGVKVGTGLWHGTNGVTRVTDGFIRFTSSDWSSSTMFEPTNEVLSVRSSHIRDLHYWAIFNSPGFYTYEDFPLLPQDYLAAVTVVADEDDNCSFAIGLSGAWQLVSRDVFAPELGVEYEILIRVDYATYCISYDVVSEGGNIHLGEYDFTPEVEQLMLEFAGPGAVAQITGICQDAHLMQVGDEEYWDFESARDAAGSTNNIIPLWRSRYYVKDGDGLFRLLDPKGLLELIFAKWYHCFITPDGDVRIYRYIAGNNWIEYADVSGVVRTADGWLVTNEVGLAWIAESATNKWFCGNVMLGANLDLASKNWTPVAQFTGTFDGNGHAIAGLNNTNVIAELGEIGRYPFGPTNDWGRTAYGLFATATNATFRNVAFGDVAIDNFSESVAALLGMHLGGDLTVSNVVVSSGNVQGEGGAVAGILGTSEGWNNLTVAGNTNAAVIEAFAEGAEPRWAAGILTVGGTNETVGPLVVAGNANLATVGNTIYNSEDGGNVAQIIAGTTWGTKFGDVDVLDNAGLGGFDVAWVNHDACRFDLPICNLAAAVVQTAADGRYRRFVEAHDPGAVPVDPVHRTARMLGS